MNGSGVYNIYIPKVFVSQNYKTATGRGPSVAIPQSFCNYWQQIHREIDAYPGVLVLCRTKYMEFGLLTYIKNYAFLTEAEYNTSSEKQSQFRLCTSSSIGRLCRNHGSIYRCLYSARYSIWRAFHRNYRKRIRPTICSTFSPLACDLRIPWPLP